MKEISGLMTLNPMVPIPSNSRGFTLLEILAAVVIISITFTGIFKLYSRLISAHTALNFYDRAPLLADKLMDEWVVGMAIQGVPPALDTPQAGFDGFEYQLAQTSLEIMGLRSENTDQTGPLLVKLSCTISYDDGRYHYTSTSVRLIPQ